MSDVPQGPGWWQASDGKYYPPEQFPGGTQPGQPGQAGQPGPPGQPGQPAPQAYGYGVAQPAGAQNEPLAIAALVSSIAGIVLTCCWIGILGSIAGLIMGFIARGKIRDSNGRLKGDGMALAGIIVGGVGIVLFIAWIVLVVVAGTIDSPTYD